MSETASLFLQSELDYRAARIRSGAGGRRRHVRVPRLRRPAAPAHRDR